MEGLGMNEMLQELISLNKEKFPISEDPKKLPISNYYLFVEKPFEQYYIVTNIDDLKLPERCKKDGNTIIDGKVSYKIISMDQYKQL